MKWRLPIFLMFCSITTGLAACQSLRQTLPNPFAPAPASVQVVPAAEIPAEISVSPSPIVPVSIVVQEDNARITTLQSDYARLKSELTNALRENARLKKDLADAIDDNSLLKDLAEKKQR